MLHGLKNARKYHESNRVLDFEILNAGQGYTDESEVSLVGSKSGTGFVGLLETNASGSIIGVQILEAGKNYSSYQSIEISDENGTGAIIRPIIGSLSWDEANVGAISIDDHTLRLTLETPHPIFLNSSITTVGFQLILQQLRNSMHLKNKAPHGLVREIMWVMVLLPSPIIKLIR